VAQIREMGRSTQGVTLIALSEGEKLAGIARIEDRAEDGNGGNGSGEEPEPPVAPAEPGPQGPTIH
jgi:DNA gyrase subunit A